VSKVETIVVLRKAKDLLFRIVPFALCCGVAVPSGAQEGSIAPVVSVELSSLRSLGAAHRLAHLVPPAAAQSSEDPADSLYRLARRAMADENYRTAARLFLELADQYPRSDYAGDALYYRAYALYQLGGRRNLTDAKEALDRQSSDYPRAGTREDAKTLLTRIQTEQARRGDADAAQKVVEKAKQLSD